MAWSGSGADTESVSRRPLNAMTRLSQRTPLRVKLIAALLTLVALALAVISFTSTAVFQRYLLNQADSQLAGLLSNAYASLTTRQDPGIVTDPHRYFSAPGNVVEALDPDGNRLGRFGNAAHLAGSPPDLPASTAWLNAHASKPVTVPAQAGGTAGG